MRKFLVGATALCTTVLFLVPGFAMAQSVRDWTGPYVGASLGAVNSRSSILLTPSSFSSAEIPLSGSLVGVNAGFDYDFGAAVIGLEAEAAGTNAIANVDNGSSYGAGLSSLLSLRARLGLKAGDALIYGTGGIAGGRVSTSTQIGAGSEVFTSTFATGTIVGAGIEYALTDTISIKTEGLMYQLASVQGAGDSGKLGSAYTSDYKPTGAVLKTGINFRL